MSVLRARLDFALMGRSLWTLSQQRCVGTNAKLRLFVVYAALVLRAILGRTLGARPLRLRISIGGRERDWWVADAMEVATLWEVFVAGGYGDWLPAEVALVIDAGANVGTTTAWFRERYPSARVVAVEANPEVYVRLRSNVGDDPAVTTVHAAIAGRDGTMHFAAEHMSGIGHVVDGAEPGTVPVESLTLDSLRARTGDGRPVDVLKLDVEGSEWPVLSGSLDGIGTIVLEAHEPVPGGLSYHAALQAVCDRERFTLRDGVSPTAATEPLLWLTRDQSHDPADTPS